jgi:hypothetical protein
LADVDALRFEARIGRLGMNYCVDVPLRVSRSLGGAQYIQVIGEAAGRPFQTTLVPRGRGGHRLFLDSAVRGPAGVSEGDRVLVDVALDPEPMPSVPNELAEALERIDGGPAAFAALPPGMRRSVLRWLEAARRPETRERRIERIVDEAVLRARTRASAAEA